MGPELVGQLISEFPLFLYIRTEKAQRLTDQQDQITYCMFTLYISHLINIILYTFLKIYFFREDTTGLTKSMFTLGTEVIRSTSSDHISLPTLGTEGDQRLTYSIE